MRPGCKARQYSDTMICDACGLQWDVNDPEPPECDLGTAVHCADPEPVDIVSGEELAERRDNAEPLPKEQALERIEELRAMLGGSDENNEGDDGPA